jgi:hypothetical protein
MATDKSVATSVDVLTSLERKLVVDSLSLKRASVVRAQRAASSDAVAAAYALELQSVDALIGKFR